jgi:Phosphopantetheine attachment site
MRNGAARSEERISVRATIVSQLQQVATEHGKTLPSLTDEVNLFESGLDSLDIAIVVARLADLLGADPFSSGVAMDFPATFGNFVRMYEYFRSHSSDPAADGFGDSG